MCITGGIFRKRDNIKGCRTIDELKWLEYKGDIGIKCMSEDYTEVLKEFDDSFEEPRDYNLTQLGDMFVAWQ